GPPAARPHPVARTLDPLSAGTPRSPAATRSRLRLRQPARRAPETVPPRSGARQLCRSTHGGAGPDDLQLVLLPLRQENLGARSRGALRDPGAPASVRELVREAGSPAGWPASRSQAAGGGWGWGP